MHATYICEGTIYSRESDLTKHIKNKHLTYRTSSNEEIATSKLYKEGYTNEENHWEEGLKWLSTIDASKPPPFRQTLFLKVQWKLRSEVLDLFADVIEATAESSKQPKRDEDIESSSFDSTPFWLLLIIFEQLVLAPIPREKSISSSKSKSKQSTTSTIYRRIRMFRAGRLKELFDESRQVISKSPAQFSSRKESAAVSMEKAAQLAADDDNYRTANARLTKATPVARITSTLLPHLQKLYPPVLSRHRTRKVSARRRASNQLCNQHRIVFTPKAIMSYILKLKKGKAPGLQCDSLDIFIALASRIKHASKSNPCPTSADTLATIFNHLANGDPPPKVQEIFKSTYLVALHKDEADPTKLRPLGVPAAIRRITANAVASTTRSEFASFLLPFNYAVGVRGGINFIQTSIRLAVEKYISHREDKNLLPTRALVSIDIKNMFNAISRHKLREIVQQEFPHLTAFVDYLYESPGNTYLKMSDGSWESIEVAEGFAQGCPLSPILAAIVLDRLLKNINKKLVDKARKRDKASSDDGEGGLPIISLRG